MERPKSSRNKTAPKGNDFNLKVLCLTPATTSSDEHDASVYEIDIHSDLEFHNGKLTARNGLSRASASRSSPNDALLENGKSAEFRNPFINSYYPTFLETHSEENESQTDTEEVQTNSQIVVAQAGPVVEKLDKENQSPSLHSTNNSQQGMKNYFLEDFFSKNKGDLRTMFQNCDKKLDNALHLHHHEHHHHHHYYFDKSLGNESDSSTTSRQTNEKGNSNREKASGKSEPDSAYQCSGPSNTTFTCVKMMSERNLPAKIDESEELRESSAIKTSMSEESVLHKKSDFIKSHVYSDTDVAKCENEEVDTDGNNSKKIFKSNHNVLVNSLRNINQLRSPLIITNQETLPKFSYIQCTSMGAAEKTSSVSLININNDKAQGIEKIKGSSEDLTKGAGARKIFVSDRERKVYFEFWKAKLKEELKQIKEELHQFEEDYFSRKNSSPNQFRSGNAVRGPGVNHKIAVYSNETFIVGPGRLNVGCAPGGKEIPFNKVSFEESVTNKVSFGQFDKRGTLNKKRMRRAVQRIPFQRV